MLQFVAIDLITVIQILRSKKYMKIFYHIIDLCVVNAWLLYRRVNNNESYLPLVDFKMLISEVLCEVKRTTPKRKGRPTAEENKTQGLIETKKKRAMFRTSC
uniref:PiggyBac transposable element-derived protein domain-containing protein n=1 Tax=Sipha flava TaxID=143950 RepID=A0A2S2QMI0_9HEMI